MPDWVKRIHQLGPGFEREVVDRYTVGLLEIARRRLPKQLRPRVDPEDVLQSVYRSFFRRLGEGQFQFEGPDDLWRLLATMTFRKVCNACKFHTRDRRDARRDLPLVPRSEGEAAASTDMLAMDEDIDVLWECLDELLRNLPESCRDILVLRLQGHPIESIGPQVGRSRRTVMRVLAGISASAAAHGGRCAMTIPPITPAPNDSWRHLEATYDRFEAEWVAHGNARIEDFLPAEESPERERVLHELIRIDLDLHWSRGQIIHVEDYLGRFPQLACEDVSSIALIRQEIKVRQAYGRGPSIAELRSRFPQHIASLQRRA